MGQLIFFSLFIISLLAGAFAYFAPLQKPFNPLGYFMHNSGYESEETTNHKRIQKLNMSTSKGLLKIRKEMDDIALEQNKFLDMIQDQQKILENADRDLLRLNALTTEMQDQQRLLVAHGQDLISLNNQLTKNRQWIADQLDLVNLNNDISLQQLQQRYTLLQNQAAGFFDKVSQHNQEVRDRMDKMKDRLNDLANNAAYDSAVQQQSSKETIERMLDKEHEDMIKLADSEDRSRSLLKDAQQNFSNSKELFNDSLQQTQSLIEDERQKEQDQLWVNQQRIADQRQRSLDQQKK